MSNSFINPYTFVKLRNGKTPYREEPNSKLLSGKISCELITKTQIAIPDNPVGKNEYNMNKYPFFRVNGNAVIPGSSIRGVIRNVYETLTNSCLHINDKESDLFTSRQNKKDAGLLAFENGNYYLYSAVRYRVTNPKDKIFKTGVRVSFTEGVSDNKNLAPVAKDLKIYTAATKGLSGVYLKVDDFGSNNPSVFVVKYPVKKIPLPKEVVEAFKANVELYSPKNPDVKREYKDCFASVSNGKGRLPVWYHVENGYYYLAQSQLSRSVFINKPKDLIARMKYSPCSNSENMCEGCALFGMVGRDRNSDTVAGRVRFTDAICSNKECFDEFRILPVLSEPRLSSFDYYLLPNEKGEFGAPEKNKRGEDIYCMPSPDKKGVVIAGRKFYWHNKDCMINTDDKKSIEIATAVEDKANFSSSDSCLQLVKKDQIFSFDIFFDNISDKQLKQLAFTLNFGDNNKEKLCHKIGHGKPVGLGTVKIKIKDIICREFNGEEYSLFDVTEKYSIINGRELFNGADYDQVIRVSHMNSVDSGRIHYPFAIDEGKQTEAYAWFSANRETIRTKSGMQKIKNHLPLLMASNQCLEAYDVTKQNAGNYGSKKTGGPNNNRNGKRY